VDYDTLIEKIAEGLDTTVEFVSHEIYPILIRQAYIDGIIRMVGGLLLLATVAVIGYKAAKYLIREERELQRKKKEGIADFEENEMAGPIFLFFIVIMFPATIIGVLIVLSSITPLLNPDYYIIEEILKHL